MNETLKHDSTKTFKPIIYQFLVALEKYGRGFIDGK